jgi:adenylylsulfate kinase
MSRGAVIWITGLPASGKSTLAARLHERLVVLGVPSCLLDSDRVRECLVPSPGYDEDGRAGFYETLARLAAMLMAQGLVVLVPATANRRAFRDNARRRVPHFIEVFVDVPPEECAARDPKGLYAKSRTGAAKDLPGAGAAYEPPIEPEVVARGGEDLDAIARVTELLARSPGSRRLA